MTFEILLSAAAGTAVVMFVGAIGAVKTCARPP
jgi:hypothetical protein